MNAFPRREEHRLRLHRDGASAEAKGDEELSVPDDGENTAFSPPSNFLDFEVGDDGEGREANAAKGTEADDEE